MGWVFEMNHLQNRNCGYVWRMTHTSPHAPAHAHGPDHTPGPAPDHARALAALGHDARLSIFRLLVKAGAAGLRVSDIGALLGLAPSTLAHHLGALTGAGLVVQDRQGREVFNRVDFPAMNALVGFLTSECCAGVTLKPAAPAAPAEDAA